MFSCLFVSWKDLSLWQRYTPNDLRYSKNPNSRCPFSLLACVAQREMIVMFLYLLSNGVIYSPLWEKLECEKHSTIIYFLFKKPGRTHWHCRCRRRTNTLSPKNTWCCQSIAATLLRLLIIAASFQHLISNSSISASPSYKSVNLSQVNHTKALAVINLKRDCLSVYSMQDLSFNTHHHVIEVIIMQCVLRNKSKN